MNSRKSGMNCEVPWLIFTALMIRLENFNNTFYNRLISWVNSEEALMQFAGPGFSFPLTREQLYESLRDSNRFAFSVINEETQIHIGHCEIYLKETSFSLGRILIGDPGERGKGLGKEIVQASLEFGFANFDRGVAELYVFDWNMPAITCYTKVGFTFSADKKLERKVAGKTWTAIKMIYRRPL